MLADERKGAVDALSDSELEIEVARGRESRFQRELYDYARAQLALRKELKQVATDKAALEVAQANVRATKQIRNATHWIYPVSVDGLALESQAAFEGSCAGLSTAPPPARIRPGASGAVGNPCSGRDVRVILVSM